MRFPQLSPISRAPDGGAHQRVTEPSPDAEFDQSCRLGRRRGISIDTKRLRRAPHQRHVAQRFGRRDEQKAPGINWKRLQLPPEALFDAVGQLRRLGQSETQLQLGRSQPSRQFQQCQRIAARFRNDPGFDPLVEPPGDRRVEKRPRVAIAETADRKVRDPGQFVCTARLADREDQPHRLGQQPPRRERQHLR